MAAGAWSPPIASMAIGSIGGPAAVALIGAPFGMRAMSDRPFGPSTAPCSRFARFARSVDLDGHAAAVPAAVAAHDVGQLGRVAARADATGGAVEAPRARPGAAALGLRGLLLGDGHGGSPVSVA